MLSGNKHFQLKIWFNIFVKSFWCFQLLQFQNCVLSVTKVQVWLRRINATTLILFKLDFPSLVPFWQISPVTKMNQINVQNATDHKIARYWIFCIAPLSLLADDCSSLSGHIISSCWSSHLPPFFCFSSFSSKNFHLPNSFPFYPPASSPKNLHLLGPFSPNPQLVLSHHNLCPCCPMSLFPCTVGDYHISWCIC